MTDSRAKHWIGTLDATLPKFWENPVTLEHIEYIKLQEEQGHGDTAFRHFQIYMCLKQKKSKNWILKHISPDSSKTNHWEVKRGTVAEAIDYVSKEDTRVPDGITFEYGEKPVEKGESKAAKRTREEIQEEYCQVIKKMKAEYVPITDIDEAVIAQPGFISVYKAMSANWKGPYRPNLKIVTLIGPPGCGKSYAVNKWFPNAGSCVYGNSGPWFQQPWSRVMIFEEFMGQIPLQTMLTLLDPYPNSLEIKGGHHPAMYDLVIITSNTTPDKWYKNAEEIDRRFHYLQLPQDPSTAADKREDALAALYDRLGYRKLGRDCGEYHHFHLPLVKQPGPMDRHTNRDILAELNKIREDINLILARHRDRLDHTPAPHYEPTPDPIAVFQEVDDTH